MKKICVVHSSAEVCGQIVRIMHNFLLSANAFNPLVDSSYIDFIYHHQPKWIFIEDGVFSSDAQSTHQKINVLSPQSELHVIASRDKNNILVSEKILFYEDELGKEEVPANLLHLFSQHMYDEISTYTSLTETEKQILALLMQGNSPRKISLMMKRKYNTIRKHVQHIYEKTNIHHYKSFQQISPLLFILMQANELLAEIM